MIKLLSEEQPKGIPVNTMKDGDIGVIVVGSGSLYIGTIVQRYKNDLIAVGQHSGEGWGAYFSKHRDNNHRVRLLEPVEKLIVT